jgi:hypothetical protein
MENKQPEDDLFDRLNVSGYSALGFRESRPSLEAHREAVAWKRHLPTAEYCQSPETGSTRALPFILPCSL